MAKSKSAYKVIRVKVPKPTKKRYKWTGKRTLQLDFRGVNEMHSSRKFKSPEQLEVMCNEYFASCYGVVHDNKGKVLRDENDLPIIGQIKPFTVSGLARYLGIATSTLRKYGLGLRDLNGYEREEVSDYSDVVRAAKQRIEEYAEGRLYDKDGYNGARFVLDSAFGWLGHKEAAEIRGMNFNANMKVKDHNLKQKEFELKKDSISNIGDDEPLHITITRASKEEE